MEKTLRMLSRFHWLAGVLLLGAAVYVWQRYLLYDMEQTRVLVYERSRVLGQLAQVGGVADFLALFLQQFFRFPLVAVFLMVLLYGKLTLAVRGVAQVMAERSLTLTEQLLCWLPAALLFVYTEDHLFFITGHVALFLAVAVLWLWTLAARALPRVAVAVLTLLLVPLTGFAVGPCVWVLVGGMLLFHLSRSQWVLLGFVVLTALLTVVLAQRFCLAVTPSELFSPNIYNLRTRTNTLLGWVWLATLVVTFAPRVVPERWTTGGKAAVTALVAVVAVTWQQMSVRYSEATHQRLALQYQLDHGQWQPAYEFCSHYLTNPFTANIYCQIAAQQGALESKIGLTIGDPAQLIMPENTTRLVRRHLMSLYYYIGYVYGAQVQAFEYNEPSEGMMCPEALKLLVKTNMIQGHYAVAEKYLRYLEHTLFYRSWAKQYRALLYDDAAVEADPELGPRRQGLAIESVPARWTTVPHIIRQISHAAPTLPATQYYRALRQTGAFDSYRPQNNELQPIY
ncbi:MAG: hypothetical protein HUK02_01535 [Bacteroidaceae bacterium]|nr:hypothetical protein [Bacteroidaceae bacterium]